jgi:hypothetical protein
VLQTTETGMRVDRLSAVLATAMTMPSASRADATESREAPAAARPATTTAIELA